MIQLGRLTIPSPLILAPMAMYSDIGLRKICTDYGSSYSFTEQIHTSRFIKKDPLLARKLDMHDKIGIQFLTNSPQELKQAIQIVNNKEFYPNLNNITSIDINLGCPTPDIMNQNLGSALLNQPKLIRELFQTLNKYSPLPISAKFRLAIDAKHKKSKPYLRIAKIAEEENLDFITIHARSAGQQYEGLVDINALQEVHDNITIPLIGNGGINNEQTAKTMLKYCNAIMIGQHALKSPYIFKQLDYYLQHNEKLTIDTFKEKKYCIQQYLKYAQEYNIGFQHVKIHLQGFLKDLPFAKEPITALTHTSNIKEINIIMDAYFQKNKF